MDLALEKAYNKVAKNQSGITGFLQENKLWQNGTS